MTTVLLVGLLGWVVVVECRLWVNIHRLNEHLEALHQARDAVVGSKQLDRNKERASPVRPG